MAVVVGVVVASQGQQLTLQCLAFWGEEDNETSSFTWIICSGDELKARLAFAVLIAQGVDGARDSAVREV
jgi:hypothetical protein